MQAETWTSKTGLLGILTTVMGAAGMWVPEIPTTMGMDPGTMIWSGLALIFGRDAIQKIVAR